MRPRRIAPWLLVATALAMAGSLGARLWGKPRWVRVELGQRHYWLDSRAPRAPKAVVLVLHAYDTAPATQERFFRLVKQARKRDWLLVLPEGTKDAQGKRFWNATAACCAFDAHPPDDLAFIADVLADVTKGDATGAALPVAAVGVSNGAFMAQRLACDTRFERLRAVVSVSGSGPDTSGCSAAFPVALLHVHGTSDEVVPYGGGQMEGRPPFPSVEEMTATWARRNRCEGEWRVKERFSFSRWRAGDETEVLEPERCGAAPAVLWRVNGGRHQLRASPEARERVVEFLAASLE